MELFLKEIICCYYASPLYFKSINLYLFSLAYNIWVIGQTKPIWHNQLGMLNIVNQTENLQYAVSCVSNDVSGIQELIIKARKGKRNKIIIKNI